jgi:hypothetical protein
MLSLALSALARPPSSARSELKIGFFFLPICLICCGDAWYIAALLDFLLKCGGAWWGLCRRRDGRLPGAAALSVPTTTHDGRPAMAATVRFRLLVVMFHE